MTRKLTYREIVREFLLFLKTENAYEGYITSVKHHRIRQIKNWGNAINILTIPCIERCFKDSSVLCHLIDHSFCWDDTKEGYDFWSALDIKWRGKMKDTEIVAEKLTNS